MDQLRPEHSYAQELDSSDPLAGFRDHFVINDPDLIYVDGNSLGRLPRAAVTAVETASTAKITQRSGR